MRSNRFGWKQSRAVLHRAARTWPAMLCAQLVSRPELFPQGATCTMPDRQVPGTVLTAAMHLRGLLVRALITVKKLLFVEPWAIGYVHAPVEAILSGEARLATTWLAAPDNHTYQADPFAVPTPEGVRIIYEEFDYRTGIGHLRLSGPLGEDCLAACEPVMQLPVHMSYPFVFTDEGTLYCIPETYQSRGAHLFQAGETPNDWRFVRTLIDDFAAADATVLKHDGLYWIFCTDVDELPNANLHVWYAHSLTGPWTAHPLNPVKCDIRSARPAGPIVKHDGKLLRPGQDCAQRYGAGIAVNEIVTLTTTRFEERVVRRLAPDPGGPCRLGLHTLCAAGNMTLVDGRYRRFRLGSSDCVVGRSSRDTQSATRRQLELYRM